MLTADWIGYRDRLSGSEYNWTPKWCAMAWLGGGDWLMGIEPTLWKQHFECRDAWRRGKPAIEGELDGWRMTLKPPLFLTHTEPRFFCGDHAT